MPRNPVDPEPDIVGAALGEIADQILAAEQQRSASTATLYSAEPQSCFARHAAVAFFA